MNIGQFPSDCLKIQSDSHYLIKYPRYKKYCPDYGLFRSVIYRNDNTPVCFSPPKSIPFTFTIPLEQCIIEEFVEGTMINVFYDTKWIISTKSKVGAECTFDSPLTFADMFYECINNTPQWEQLDTRYTYSFVMQHTANRIVTVITENKLILVAMYEIIDNLVYEKEVPFLAPQRFTFSSYDELIRKAQEMTCKGLVVKSNGYRWKVRNIEHENIEKIKGSSFQYHYLCIRSKPDVVAIYFNHFPENSLQAEHMEYKIKSCAVMLFSSYKECFIAKKNKLNTYLCSSYLYELHGIYLRQRPYPLQQTQVLNYVNSLTPARLLTLIRLWF